MHSRLRAIKATDSRPSVTDRPTHKGQISTTGAFERCAAFLQNIGIPLRFGPPDSTFLPGVAIEAGALVVASPDDRLACNILHEAGHLAIIPARFRPFASGDLTGLDPHYDAYLADHPEAFSIHPEDPIARGILQASECEAIAWSFAAAHAIRIDTRIPFMDGFQGDGLELHDSVQAARHFGIHGLAAAGMTDLPHRATGNAFPAMRRWLQI